MLADVRAIDIKHRPGFRPPSRALAQGIAVIAAGHEADLLGLGLVGGGEAERAGDGPNLGLGQLPEREAGVLELLGTQAIQEVGLVLLLVAGPQEARSTVIADDAARVVAGCHCLAVVQVAGPPEQCPELHVGVAVDARARRPAVEIRIEERRQDPGVELALEVHDVERDAELGSYPAGIIGGVEGATALLELGVGVRDVVQPHPHADDLVALLVDERRRDGRIHSARHRDEDATHAGTPCPSGSAATAPPPSRIDAMTLGTTSLAVSMSASVVVRPSDKRSAPRASSSG